MQTAHTQSAPVTIANVNTGAKRWTGRVLGGLVLLFLAFDTVVKLLQASPAIEATVRLGYPEHLVLGIGLVELVCTVLYLVPRTSLLGAVLLTGYLGGATASHLRHGDPFWFPLAFGALVWTALLLRDGRLRSLFFQALGAATTGATPS
ncbi:MAG TPA: DoxX family protein [Polyangiaceae bacterium]|jgi:hypothetical protein